MPRLYFHLKGRRKEADQDGFFVSDMRMAREAAIQRLREFASRFGSLATSCTRVEVTDPNGEPIFAVTLNEATRRGG